MLQKGLLPVSLGVEEFEEGVDCVWCNLTLSSRMVADFASLDDSKHRVPGVIVTGIMDAVFLARSWSAEKHAVWNIRCRKALLMHSCAVDIRQCVFDTEFGCLWICKSSMSIEICLVRRSMVQEVRSTEEWCVLLKLGGLQGLGRPA